MGPLSQELSPYSSEGRRWEMQKYLRRRFITARLVVTFCPSARLTFRRPFVTIRAP